MNLDIGPLLVYFVLQSLTSVVLMRVTAVNLNQALSDIAAIREQIGRAESYRGFRSLTVGLSALFVVTGGCLQQIWIEYPEQQPLEFLRLWIVVALLSGVACTVEMLLRNRASNSPVTGKLHRSLITQTMPSVLVGAVVTIAIYKASFSNETLIHLLPGVWAMLYGLGLWSCGSNLPRLAHVATVYFLVAGAITLLLNSYSSVLHSAEMVILFGVGQLLLSAALFWKFERRGSEGVA